MICEECNKCTSLKIDNGIYKVNCQELGILSIAEVYGDRYECDKYAEYVAPAPPPKDNVMVVLSGSGRDFLLRDDDISSLDDLFKRIVKYDKYVEIGGVMFKANDIASFLYIAE